MHTPGPWKATPGTNAIVAADGKFLAHDVGPYSRGGGAPHDERAANAKLIAAAPDLLAAARFALEYFAANEDDENDYASKRATALRDAIAKAVQS